MHAPDIKAVDVSRYTGKVGDTIEVEATDDFRVSVVKVAIYNADGSIVESGDTQQVNEAKWLYTATAENASLDGDKIVIRAYDLPGNVSEKNNVL
jgi:hypothetical protein